MEHYFAPSYWLTLTWGLAVLLGLIGLGRLAARVVGGEAAAQAGWGLHAVWGMAVYLFLGAILAVFHACDEMGITLLIGVGLAALIWTTARGGWPPRPALAGLPWAWWLAFALVAFGFAAGAAQQHAANWWDDCAYYTYCEKLLVTGSFDDPFSWRRLASLGGQTLLLSSTVAKTSLANATLFETAIAPVIFLGLLFGFRQGALRRHPLGVFIALLAVTASPVRGNAASVYTGIVLFMGLFVTLDSLERVGERRRNWLLAVGLVAAAVCSLRAHFVAAAGGALGFYWIGWWLRDRPTFRRILIDGLWCAGALLAALLPWMIMSYRSNQSPLFPLFVGGHSAAFNPVGIDGTFYQKMTPVMAMLVHPWVLSLLLCLLALPFWKKELAGYAVAASAVVASLVLAYGIGLSPDQLTIPRYVQPLLFVAAFAALATAALTPRLRMAAWVLAAIALLTSIDIRTGRLKSQFESFGAPENAAAVWGPRMVADYRRAQLLIPEGRRVLVCADFPFLFDHLRNDLWNIDLPHGTSPPPGLPYRQPPAETKRYLRQLGIEYIIYLDFGVSRGNYNRADWWKRRTEDVALLRIQAPFYEDFFQTIDAFTASETVLGKAGPMTALQFKP